MTTVCCDTTTRLWRVCISLVANKQCVCVTHIRGSAQFSGLSLLDDRKTHLDPSWVTPPRENIPATPVALLQKASQDSRASLIHSHCLGYIILDQQMRKSVYTCHTGLDVLLTSLPFFLQFMYVLNNNKNDKFTLIFQLNLFKQMRFILHYAKIFAETTWRLVATNEYVTFGI